VRQVCRFLARNRDRIVTLAELGRLLHLSPYTAQKKFVRAMGLSPRQYQLQLRADDLRRRLRRGGPATVTEAIYEAGYSSSSRFYERAPEHLGMSPVSFRKGGRGRNIRFATAPCPLGQVLVAATELGVCSVMLGDDPHRLEAQLREQFPQAGIAADPEGIAGCLGVVLSFCELLPVGRDLPLDLRATAFQARVWQALREIPRGETRSYAEMARIVGRPAAVRAVARACASNPVAILVPCHRVVGGDGSLTGYRWGLERKKALLEMERRPQRRPQS
jgi:AraC family transcriptional regulator of adaptative response/methylated-DNA-[protein]-cysteine methyltransferase